MTTTIFRKDKNLATMASDTRVSWVDNSTHLVSKWFDNPKFTKTLMLDGVMYGFAGTNWVFKSFLANYTTLDKSIELLDTLAHYSKRESLQFFIIRYDGNELRLFAFSPASDDAPMIYKISTDNVIDKNMFAIGSGKHSKQYNKNKHCTGAQTPIYKIISANQEGMRKHRVLDLEKAVETRTLTADESRKAYQACKSKGGDLFTGGEVKMSQEATKQMISQQIQIMATMDAEAKAHNAVCASPVDASLEVKYLKDIGHAAVSPEDVTVSSYKNELLEKLSMQFKASMQ